jgi:D-sedoheptulose 7-phosphate isomerase
MDWDALYKRHWDGHEAAVRASRTALAEPCARLAGICVGSIQAGGKIMFFGNGGSAADAQNLATELAVRYDRDRPAIAALALTTDSSVLTAAGNDLGFEHLFARQVEALGRAGDVAIGISTSGKSANVINGLRAAKARGIVPAALSGRDGGDLVGLADPLLIVPSQVTAHIQEIHITIGQLLCDAIQRGLGLVKD